MRLTFFGHFLICDLKDFGTLHIPRIYKVGKVVFLRQIIFEFQLENFKDFLRIANHSLVLSFEIFLSPMSI